VNEIAAKLGAVGLPEPVAALADRDWDAVIVGGGHNGLTAAAYLAKAGRSVLVLERRERLGGAATLERPFADPGFVVSPCAYVRDRAQRSQRGRRRARRPGRGAAARLSVIPRSSPAAARRAEAASQDSLRLVRCQPPHQSQR
jgi:glycine/D-amino acid oxidase-like deaminating enzyme